MDALQVYLKAKGFDISPEFTGKVQRFNRSGELSGWFVGTRIKAQGALVEVANFGDWRTDEKCQSCEKKEGNEEHTCPFQAEINGDEEFKCNCCEDCTEECALAIS